MTDSRNPTDSRAVGPSGVNRPTWFFDSNAAPRRCLGLPEGLRLVQYRNGCERVYYQNEISHTFSLYLDGGHRTQRTDQQSRRGGPGLFCLMPKGAYSAWDIGPTQEFMHLYFDDDYLKRLALKTFDLDPRRVELPELNFDADPAIEALGRYGLLGWDWQSGDNSLAVEQGVQTLLVNLLKHLQLDKPEPASLTGGLAPQVRERVIDYIQANYQRPIRLAELAAIAGLSEYHFCRMFRVSLAQTPQQYLTRVRIERAKQQLEQAAAIGQKPSLAQLALDCGFSNQSHLGRQFKSHIGTTPGQYLRSRR
ncbi:helix-turn-helix domain-containing protein [Motiliproteus sp.]|uniref:helix-turn-helix domain-containing protein n=1 Tax=Motiliproteus sp. TaxID=1898955 RepID=UPI003BADB437